MKPISSAKGAIDELNKIDMSLVEMWKEEELRQQFYNLIDDIIELANKMKRK